MNISGFTKTTLLDYPNYVACTVFTSGCNFSCPFCHNARLLGEGCHEQIDKQEIIDYLKKRVGILDGVCISGGEPTLQKGLKQFIVEIKSMGFLVKLDTNGTNYQIVKELVDENLLDYIAIDVKNDLPNYTKAIGEQTQYIDNISKCIELLKSDVCDYEFRTTVVGGIHTEQNIAEIAKLLSGCKRWYLQKFVMSENVLDGGNLHELNEKQMENLKEIAQKYNSNTYLRGM